jgi:hypothetical protein
LSYFYLLEGSKIFFMSSKCFIWIFHVLIYLWEFIWNFCDFRSTFRAFNQFLDFSGIGFAKNKFEKKLSFRFRPSPKARPAPTAPASPVARPGEAHLAKPEAAAAARHLQPAGPGRARQGRPRAPRL